MHRTLIFLLASHLLANFSFADDWPQWQGLNRNAISTERGLLKEWQEAGPPLAWRIEGIGGGDSAPAVANGKLIGMSNRDGKEIVWARQKKTEVKSGCRLWEMQLGNACLNLRKVPAEHQPSTTTMFS